MAACTKPLRRTVGEGAKLAVILARLSNLISGHAGVFAKTWPKLQMQHDLARALKGEAALRVQRVGRPAQGSMDA
jgi:hypothetical protein